jgi:hypothetical protein
MGENKEREMIEERKSEREKCRIVSREQAMESRERMRDESKKMI